MEKIPTNYEKIISIEDRVSGESFSSRYSFFYESGGRFETSEKVIFYLADTGYAI
jgi:hypothetical protein